MLKKIYYWFHKRASKPGEKGEYSGGYWQDLVRKEALLLCAKRKGKLLEVGCGEGLFLIQLAEANPGLGITGVDNDASRIELARDRLSKRNMGNVKVLVQDALKLEFTDASFESVVCINVFFNLSSQEVLKKVLKEIARVTAPGGSLVFDFRNSLNPLLRLKYGLARFYDATVKDLPLKTYSRSQIPVIMLTAVDTNEAKEKSLGLYHEDYIIKPFKTDSLVAKIKDVLSRKA